jgi:hypothetical protein
MEIELGADGYEAEQVASSSLAEKEQNYGVTCRRDRRSMTAARSMIMPQPLHSSTNNPTLSRTAASERKSESRASAKPPRSTRLHADTLVTAPAQPLVKNDTQERFETTRGPADRVKRIRQSDQRPEKRNALGLLPLAELAFAKREIEILRALKK